MELKEEEEEEEIKQLHHHQWVVRQAERSAVERYERAKQKMAMTYGHLLAKSYRLIATHLLEALDALWRGLTICKHLLGLGGRR